MKGQAAVEYAMILGLILVALIPIFYISLQNTNNSVKNTQASDLVNQIASAANTVYALGPGSTKYITINMPQGVSLATVTQNEVRLRISINGRTSDVTALAKANFSTANLPTQPGQYGIKLINDGINRRVVIGDINDTFPPVISNLKPINNSLLTYTPIELSVITNEYATCKYITGLSGLENTSYSGNDLTTIPTTIHQISLSLGNGTWSYSINCKDVAGNIPLNPVRTNFTINTSSDNTAPAIYLISPLNNTQVSNSSAVFSYNVTDPDDGISSCMLYINSTLDDGGISFNTINDISIVKGVINQFQSNLDKGNHTWYIKCVDKSVQYNTNYSEVRWVRVNQSIAWNGTILSCAQYCLSISNSSNNFVTGACDNTNGCTHIPLSTPDPYINSTCLDGIGSCLYCSWSPMKQCCCQRP